MRRLLPGFIRGIKSLRISRAAQRNAGRMTAAAVISAELAQLFGLPQGYWTVISAMVIMQGSLGGTLGAAADRVLATMAGAGAGVIGALLQSRLALPPLVLLVLATAPLSLLVVARPSFRLAPVTAAIILMTGSAEVAAMRTALDRTIEIALGCVVGVLTAHLVLPSRARSVIMTSAPAMLELLGTLARTHLTQPAAPVIETHNEQVRKQLAAIVAATAEDGRERAAHLSAGPDAGALVRTLRRLRSDVAILGRVMSFHDPASVDCAAIASALHAHFDRAAAFLRREGAPPLFAPLDATIGAVPQGSAIHFALTTLRRELDDLNDRIVEQLAER